LLRFADSFQIEISSQLIFFIYWQEKG